MIGFYNQKQIQERYLFILNIYIYIYISFRDQVDIHNACVDLLLLNSCNAGFYV